MVPGAYRVPADASNRNRDLPCSRSPMIFRNRQQVNKMNCPGRIFP